MTVMLVGWCNTAVSSVHSCGDTAVLLSIIDSWFDNHTCHFRFNTVQLGMVLMVNYNVNSPTSQRFFPSGEQLELRKLAHEL